MDDTPLDRAILAATAALGLGVLFRIGRQTLSGTLASDECFHAAVAEWIHRHRAIPVELPELYSGLAFFYPPLLHLIGAAWLALAGHDAWLGLPVVFAVLTFVTLASGALRTVPVRAGVWTAGLLLIHPSMLDMTVRLYVEPLLTLLYVWGAALLFRTRASTRPAAAIGLGLIAGLALLAKYNAWTLVAGIAAAAFVYALRGERAVAARFAGAAALALLVASPWLVRNQVLFGSAIYPALARDLEPTLYALNVARFSTPPAQFLAHLPILVGPWILALTALALAGALVRRRWTLRESVIVGAIAALAGTAMVPLAAARHLNAAIAVLALASAWGAAQFLRSRPLARLASGIAMLAILAHGLVTLPEQRAQVDPPAFLSDALPQVAARTPADARVLSAWTYDTWFYARRAATWPVPWRQRERPMAMFFTGDPDSILTDLHASGVTHVLMSARIGEAAFNSSNYPASFVRGMDALARRDAVRVLWRSQDLALIAVSPPGAKPDTLAAEPQHPRSHE